jgi:hypothetical protein
VDRSHRSIRIAGCAALLFAVASLAVGCPAPGYHPHGRPEVQRALVLPLNVVAAMPGELTGGARHVDRSLLDYLAERGKSVQTIGFKDAVAAWRAGESDCRAAAAKGCDRFASVAPFAARRLRADHDYDVLIVPYLLLRGARTNGEVASFDGVKRSVQVSGYAGYPYPLSGRIRAASLKVFGFSPDGKKMFDGIGGLEVVDQIEASDRPGAYTTQVRDNVLRDPDAIREGVARALSPLIPRPKSTES